jgi:hypothetical protein
MMDVANLGIMSAEHAAFTENLLAGRKENEKSLPDS